MSDVALALLAHPDDAEFLCAGTLIRLAHEHGWQIHIASMTPGDCGTAEHSADEIARIRRLEGAASAAQIGGAYTCLEECDLLVAYNTESLKKATDLLRKVRPRIVFTHSPDDYHLDHEMTSRIVRAAAFAAPVPLFARSTTGPIRSSTSRTFTIATRLKAKTSWAVRFCRGFTWISHRQLIENLPCCPVMPVSGIGC